MIGSSDAPAILGVSRFSTPWQLWARLVGLIPKEDTSSGVMEWGTRLEPVVVAHVVALYGLTGVIADSRKNADGIAPTTGFDGYRRATPDAISVDDYGSIPTVVEAKCSLHQPPLAPSVEHVVQCLHHLLVFDSADRCILAMFGGLTDRQWEIPRHPKALDAVERAEDRFMELVHRQEPPPVRAEDSPNLWRRWPMACEDTVVLPVSAFAWHADLMEADAHEEDATQRKELAKAKLKLAMGTATRAVLPDGSASYTWRPSRNGVRPFTYRTRGEE